MNEHAADRRASTQWRMPSDNARSARAYRPRWRNRVCPKFQAGIGDGVPVPHPVELDLRDVLDNARGPVGFGGADDGNLRSCACA